MKAKFVVLVLLILLPAILAGCNGMGYSPFLDKSFHVSLQSTSTLTVRAEVGDEIQGYLTIRGGENEIKFWVEDPNGVDIYNAGMVYDRHDFRVSSAGGGNYTLHFDNSFSHTAGKDVYIHYRVRHI